MKNFLKEKALWSKVVNNIKEASRGLGGTTTRSLSQGIKNLCSVISAVREVTLEKIVLNDRNQVMTIKVMVLN